MKPKVTIIIPVYNQEAYLEECLSAVLEQTLQDIEVLCINDGSTDSSQSIIEKFEADDPRIKCINQENTGVSSARNRGIELANGEFLIFLDPDDKYPSPETLEKLYSAACLNQALVAAGSFSILDEDTGEITASFDGTLAGYTFEKEGTVDYRDYQFDYGFHRFLINTNFLQESGIRFPPLIRFQDPPFLVEVLYRAKSFYAIPDIVYEYKLGHQQINWNIQRQLALIEGIRMILDFSRRESLQALHRLEVQRFEEEYGGVFYWSITEPLVFSALVDLNSHVEPLYFPERDSEPNFLLAPLKQQVSNAQKWEKDITDLQSAVLAERNDKENAWKELDILKEEFARLNDELTQIKTSKAYKAATIVRIIRR